ncbi:hypothetical protein GM3708_1880 [Geminocystis sp. NIES-3708]|uniref:hypothetical protein n=1 Tax=Geminocystis sp. NIES-3708 TaxID=1615909 RepID=UPI0005FC7FD1|nr:hypothetical protein [Geminocystis sp. NIES-3708]BAQ61474.1 hypothetical protein GM3708_1880 [Geminocystis sp. NIES-3708]
MNNNLDSFPQPLEFFNDIYSYYHQAVIKSQNISYYYQIAGFNICLNFASSDLISKIIPALYHLKIDEVSSADLNIYLWDSHSTGVKIPPPPWQRNHLQKRGEIIGLNSDKIYTSFQWGANALSLLDLERNLGIYWVNNANFVPYWETSSPLRSILQVWLSQKNIQLIHGGAVGLPDGGVLLVGKGGSGKSTTALSCLDSELFYLSDDYSLITTNPIPRAHSVYSTGKKKPDDVDRLPFLKPIISNSDRLGEEKALYFLHEHFPEKIIKTFPLKAVLIPRITGEKDSYLEKTSSIMGLSSLIPSTIKQLPHTGEQACKIMTNVVNQLPCYYLNLGTEIKQISSIIFNFLKTK